MKLRDCNRILDQYPFPTGAMKHDNGVSTHLNCDTSNELSVRCASEDHLADSVCQRVNVLLQGKRVCCQCIDVAVGEVWPYSGTRPLRHVLVLVQEKLIFAAVQGWTVVLKPRDISQCPIERDRR